MSTSHHGNETQQAELLKRFLDQITDTARREYPRGRMGAEDDGVLAIAYALDKPRQTLVIRFGKPVEWIGLGPSDLDDLIERLSDYQRELRGIA